MDLKKNTSFPHYDSSLPTSKKEELIQQFWVDEHIFEKSLKKEESRGEFVFYEGPPTANGKPGIHHLESRAFKDAIPRYKTMQGYHVRRKAGWDTHGLPVELQMEKKLGLSSKKDIEAFGVGPFNKACKESVQEHIGLWDAFTKRIAYWVDQEDAYYTFNPSFMESVWWVFAQIDKKGLLYKDYKVLPWCPRCGTALSSHELGQPEAYVDVKDLSVTAQFELVDEPGTFLLAWTTTPWTLPGNVALAVGEHIEYVKFKKGDIYMIASSNYVQKSLNEGREKDIEVIETVKASDLIGRSYVPLFDYFETTARTKNVEHIENAYKIYQADFVTEDDGTGVVHTAVMYGQEDFELGTRIGLPKMHVVDDTGHFIDGLGEFSGMFVKDESTDVAIIKYLAHKGLLYEKHKYEHSYPHCWRCKTPLLYYARDSWYIRVSDIRDDLVRENESIQWEPSHIKNGRFGEWLAGAKDWAVSRERYWGTPLPIWISEDGERIVVDSIETLKQYSKPFKNTYYSIRHGESDNNVKGILSSRTDSGFHLTEQGKEQIVKSIEAYNFDKPIDIIITSPLERTKETAHILAQELGIDFQFVLEDERLKEIDYGVYEGVSRDEFFSYRYADTMKYDEKNPEGESYQDVKNRFGLFVNDIENTYNGKNILIVTHGVGIHVLDALAEGTDKVTSLENLKKENIQNASIKKVDFQSIPRNSDFELDLHRPYIDSIVLEKDNKEFKRVQEVMDVWFDSGAMPYAQDHYPFEKSEWVEGPGYPADFISEAIDQTRGWFYTLHAIGGLLGRGKAYKNVICLGHLLDVHGKKMSKSLGNVVDPWEAMEKWGADTLRFWMYSVTGPGESKNFDPKTVTEVERKVFNLLRNTASFYEMYADTTWHQESKIVNSSKNSHVLDKWLILVISRLVSRVSHLLDNYDITGASRELRDVMSDMSQWYVRRSRERFKESQECQETLRKALHIISRLMAPFAPFVAEEVFQLVRTESCSESVHLASWPSTEELKNMGIYEEDNTILEQMEKVRFIVTRGLELRDRAGIKVRQPLASLTLEHNMWIEDESYHHIIYEELNVKQLLKGTETILDTHITDELRNEGIVRDVIREIQSARKNALLSPHDTVSVTLHVPHEIISSIKQEKTTIERITNSSLDSILEGELCVVIA